MHVHISLPCTGGSPLRRLKSSTGKSTDQYAREYHDMLGSCRKVLDGSHPESITLELPNSSTYWNDTKVKDFIDEFGLWSRAIVHACAMGLATKDGYPIKKSFRIVCTDDDFARMLEKRFTCQCEFHSPFNEVNWKGTENYTVKFGRFVVRVLNLRVFAGQHAESSSNRT